LREGNHNGPPNLKVTETQNIKKQV
jgi:hypothetical protein